MSHRNPRRLSRSPFQIVDFFMTSSGDLDHWFDKYERHAELPGMPGGVVKHALAIPFFAVVSGLGRCILRAW